MPQSANRRMYAASQAYNWACVASDTKGTRKTREAAQKLSNTEPGSLTEWQRWLVDHPDVEATDTDQAVGLAEMWVKVAEVQPPGDTHHSSQQS